MYAEVRLIYSLPEVPPDADLDRSRGNSDPASTPWTEWVARGPWDNARPDHGATAWTAYPA